MTATGTGTTHENASLFAPGSLPPMLGFQAPHSHFMLTAVDPRGHNFSYFRQSTVRVRDLEGYLTKVPDKKRGSWYLLVTTTIPGWKIIQASE